MTIYDQSYNDAVRRDAVEHMATEMVAGLRRALMVHGKDQHAISLMALAFVAAASEIDRQIVPGFARLVERALGRRS
jgi:hypothetical protein